MVFCSSPWFLLALSRHPPPVLTLCQKMSETVFCLFVFAITSEVLWIICLFVSCPAKEYCSVISLYRCHKKWMGQGERNVLSFSNRNRTRYHKLRILGSQMEILALNYRIQHNLMIFIKLLFQTQDNGINLVDYVVKYYLRYYDQVRNGIMWKTILKRFHLLHTWHSFRNWMLGGWMDEFQVQLRI